MRTMGDCLHIPANTKKGDSCMDLSVVHAEAGGSTQIGLSCGGAYYNPFEQEEGSLGVTILKNMSRQLDYHCRDGRNQFNIKL